MGIARNQPLLSKTSDQAVAPAKGSPSTPVAKSTTSAETQRSVKSRGKKASVKTTKARSSTALPLTPNGQLDGLEDFETPQQARTRMAAEVMEIRAKAARGPNASSKKKKTVKKG